MVKHLPVMQETWVLSLGQEDLLEKGMATHSCYSCLENPTGQRGPADTVHGVTKSRHNWVTNPFISSITIEEHFPLVIYFFCLWLEIVFIRWPLVKSNIPELKKEKENLRCIEDGPAQLPGWGEGGRSKGWELTLEPAAARGRQSPSGAYLRLPVPPPGSELGLAKPKEEPQEESGATNSGSNRLASQNGQKSAFGMWWGHFQLHRGAQVP